MDLTRARETPGLSLPATHAVALRWLLRTPTWSDRIDPTGRASGWEPTPDHLRIPEAHFLADSLYVSIPILSRRWWLGHAVAPTLWGLRSVSGGYDHDSALGGVGKSRACPPPLSVHQLPFCFPDDPILAQRRYAGGKLAANQIASSRTVPPQSPPPASRFVSVKLLPFASGETRISLSADSNSRLLLPPSTRRT